MAKDSVVSRHLTFEVTGELGEVPADVATPLAVVLAELVQNAIEHAYLDFEAEEDGEVVDEAYRDSTGTIQVILSAEDGLLRVEVLDDGSGLPDGFDFDESQSLGLSIVRDLVRSQLDGSIVMQNRSASGNGESGTRVVIELQDRDPQTIGL
jgi:two-component system, sensor histidine kinase PdtaS